MLYAAVDLGGSSGRVTVGQLSGEKIVLTEVHRFKHEPVQNNDGLFWDWQFIIEQVKAGLLAATKLGEVVSVGVDSWAVDYGLIDKDGEVIGQPHCYRDGRTDGVMAALKQDLGVDYIYGKTGIQFIFFNTMYQLFVEKNTTAYLQADKFLMVPDLINYLLCGAISTEITNASTTQLLNVYTHDWDWELIQRLGIRKELFPKINKPGQQMGVVTGHGKLDGIKVISVGSHDTASAVAGTPLPVAGTAAYISSGTWSLVGVELDAPVLTPEAFAANVTNELGADGTVRALKNVTGMWILEECRRTWHLDGRHYEMPELLSLASAAKSFKTLIDPNDPLFAPPVGMPERIRTYCVERGLTPPHADGEYAICILNSLAHAYKKTLAEISAVTGRTIEVIHILGGGSQNELLNQLTADICGMTVKTGPVEATLFGNIAVQAISAGVVANLTQARALIAKSFTSKVFQPS